MLSKGEDSVEQMGQTFREICETPVADDGLIFDSASIRGEEIRAAEEYQGVRLKMIARLARARIPVQVDIGFGDVVTPAPAIQEEVSSEAEEVYRLTRAGRSDRNVRHRSGDNL